MTINHRAPVPAGAPGAQYGAPFSAAAFISNDEVNHRLVIFEVPNLVADPDRLHHARMQHIAFEHEILDDLLAPTLGSRSWASSRWW